MDKSIKEKLLSCRTYDDAKPILETQGLSNLGHDHAHLAYSVMAKQPTVASQMLKSVIREMEDEEEKKIKEADGGVSAQSSSTTGLEKEGAEHDAPESASAQPDKKDQMGVPINESSFPPQAGGVGQQGQYPPVQQQQPGGCSCGGQTPPMGQPQQQIQYTINEAIKPLQEAIKALDRKIQETQKVEPTSLDVGSSMGHKKSLAVIKETTSNKKQDLSHARDEITKMNNYLNSGKY